MVIWCAHKYYSEKYKKEAWKHNAKKVLGNDWRERESSSSSSSLSKVQITAMYLFMGRKIKTKYLSKHPCITLYISCWLLSINQSNFQRINKSTSSWSLDIFFSVVILCTFNSSHYFVHQIRTISFPTISFCYRKKDSSTTRTIKTTFLRTISAKKYAHVLTFFILLSTFLNVHEDACTCHCKSTASTR